VTVGGPAERRGARRRLVRCLAALSRQCAGCLCAAWGAVQRSAPTGFSRSDSSLHAVPRALSPGPLLSGDDGACAYALEALEMHPRSRIVVAKARGDNTWFASTRELVDWKSLRGQRLRRGSLCMTARQMSRPPVCVCAEEPRWVAIRFRLRRSLGCIRRWAAHGPGSPEPRQLRRSRCPGSWHRGCFRDDRAS
jgi:hypothetical protein